MIDKQLSETHKSLTSKKQDPGSLSNRIKKIDQGYLELLDEEKHLLVDEKDEDRNFGDYAKSMTDQMQFTYSRTLTKLQTSVQLTKQSCAQWSTYMKDSRKWLANFVLEEGSVNYEELTRLSEYIIVNGVQRVQQLRSHNLSSIQKADIWDVKNVFKSTLRLVVME